MTKSKKKKKRSHTFFFGCVAKKKKWNEKRPTKKKGKEQKRGPHKHTHTQKKKRNIKDDEGPLHDCHSSFLRGPNLVLTGVSTTSSSSFLFYLFYSALFFKNLFSITRKWRGYRYGAATGSHRSTFFFFVFFFASLFFLIFFLFFLPWNPVFPFFFVSLLCKRSRVFFWRRTRKKRNFEKKIEKKRWRWIKKDEEIRLRRKKKKTKRRKWRKIGPFFLSSLKWTGLTGNKWPRRNEFSFT